MKKLDAVEPSPAADGANPMESLSDEELAVPVLRVGDFVDGIILSINSAEIRISIPRQKCDAIVEGREIERLDPELIRSLTPGDHIVASVVQTEDEDGNIVVSLQRAQQEQDWRTADDLLKSQDVFEGVVTDINRGGVIVRVGRVRGFVPASQLSGRWQVQQDAEGDPEARWAKLVGQKMQLKVVELDRARNRLILSERAAMRDWRKGQKDRLMTELRRGDAVSGVVTSLADFGAFVDLGGADGLIHLSELAWHRVGHPSEVVRVGQEVRVVVLNIDDDRKRIALSLRRLTPEPWSVLSEHYAVGQVVKATITRLADFGAFARVGESVEGLIHISELADHRINHPKEVVQEGAEVQVRVIRIDAQRRRLGLSLRQAPEERWVDLDWREEAQAALAQDDETVAEAEAVLAAA